MAIAKTNSLTIVSKDATTNTAVVRYIVDLTTSGQTWWNYDVKCQYTIDGVSGENESYTRLPLNSTTRVLDVQKTIYNAGGKTVNASFSYYTGTSAGTVTGNTSVYIDLPELPKYANFTEHYISSTTINAIFVHWNADATCNAVQYSLNGGNWINASGATYAIRGLQPNTNYSIKTRIRRSDSQLWTESGTLYTTTKDIGRIVKLESFEHGNDVNIEITNPSGLALRLAMKIGEVQILTRDVSAETKIISFNDEDLDKIYKLYGSSNELTATFILSTVLDYSDSKTCKIILTGNQKTAKIGINNTIKRCKAFVCINGEIKKAVFWIGDKDKIPRRCI